MSLIPINLATEDELSEVVLRRIITSLGRFTIGAAHRRGGFGYLRSRIQGWNRAAKGLPFIVLTDLDRYRCPSQLIMEWLPNGRHENLLCRVAVREVESWLLADRRNFAAFLGVSEPLVPCDPDTLADPKAALVELARKARSRDLRESIAPKKGSTAKQGPDYNACLSRFVLTQWNIRAARSGSPSLHRALVRFKQFRPVWE